MQSKRSQEGYLMIDHRASPGLPEKVAIASGYDPKLCGEGKLFEAATLTCGHCKVSVVKNPLRTRARETCEKCSHHYICDICAFKMTLPDYSHLPYDKVIDMTLNGQLGTLMELLAGNEQI
jgi:hypothetical protein